MATQLLETKLYAPRPRQGVVPRPRLSAMLDRGARTRLTLLSAPPGFGKSTLLADWLAGESSRGRVSGWRIASAEPVPGEPPLGWLAHYAIGVTFAFLLIAVSGPAWLDALTILPALVIGLGRSSRPGSSCSRRWGPASPGRAL